MTAERRPPEPGLDRLLDGALRLRQANRGHRAGTDSILLAAAAPPTAGLMLDAGSGAGAAGLAAALRNPAARLELLEIDAESCALARENLALNGLEDRGRAVTVDLLSAAARRAAGIEDGRAALVLSNPPFLDAATARLSPDPAKARAHGLARKDGLTDWIRMTAALAAPGGRLALIHRADRIIDVLGACAARFGAIAVLPVHPHANSAATRIVIVATKGSRAPPRLLPGLVLHEPNGRFTERAEALHRGRALLDELF